MAKYQMQCGGCGAKINFSEKLLGQTRNCPKCGAPVVLSGEPLAGEAAPPAAPKVPEAKLPERMKANKVVAGRTCPGCGKGIQLGDDVFNCRKCGESMHLSCFQQAGACASTKCMTFLPEPETGPAPSAAAAGATKDCRFCGEKININAIKCKYCGEYQSDERRNAAAKAQADENLTWWEVVFGVLCGLIACIVGIVWAVQGKKKGYKLIAVALIANAVATIIQLIIARMYR